MFRMGQGLELAGSLFVPRFKSFRSQMRPGHDFCQKFGIAAPALPCAGRRPVRLPSARKNPRARSSPARPAGAKDRRRCVPREGAQSPLGALRLKTFLGRQAVIPVSIISPPQAGGGRPPPRDGRRANFNHESIGQHFGQCDGHVGQLRRAFRRGGCHSHAKSSPWMATRPSCHCCRAALQRRRCTGRASRNSLEKNDPVYLTRAHA